MTDQSTESSGTQVPWNLADLWELTTDHYPDREALVVGSQRVTYREIEERSNALAHVLADAGVGPGDHVACYMQNCVEFVETMLAAFKIRAVPLNVNYRYVHAELSHLLQDGDAVAVVFHRRFTDAMAEVAGDLDDLRISLVVDDIDPRAEPSQGDPVAFGAIDYTEAVGAASTARDFGPRSGDDIYLMYTGGTTGMPKGVEWRMEDAFFACVGGGDPMRLLGPVSSIDELCDRILDDQVVVMACAPLIHAAAQWTSMSWWLCGGRMVLLPGSFDGAEVWRQIEAEGVNILIVIGDAMARPLLDAWDDEGGFEVPSLYTVSSGGAPLNPNNKARLQEILPNLIIADGYGSSETGAQGTQRLMPGDSASEGTKFVLDPEVTCVLDEDMVPIEPGSDTIGKVARTGRMPLGYYGDPKKTAETFVEANGKRWAITGDQAVVEADGTITVLGRGSVSINTGGEKVFPEEVEAALKTHPDVFDTVVVGVPDERWGETIAAIVAATEGAEPTLDVLKAHVRTSIAGYKVPRKLVIVDEVVRSPTGKADYPWAKKTASDRE